MGYIVKSDGTKVKKKQNDFEKLTNYMQKYSNNGKNFISYSEPYQNLQTQVKPQKVQKQNNSGLVKKAKGNFFQQVFGTAGDILADVGEGILGFSEGIADTLTYGAANVVGLFNEDLANDWRENAKFNSTEALFGKDKNKNMFGNWRNDLDEYSRSGDFGDMVFKGIGTTAGAVGTAGLGAGAGVWSQTSNAATFIPMFTSSYGNAKSEALNNGADNFNATVSALKSGTIDGFTELMFGALPGLNKGSKLGNTITDAVGKGAEKAFGKTAGRIAINLTKTMGEGAEEVFGNIFNAQANDILNFITNGKYNYGMENQTGNIFKDTMNVLSDAETWKEFLSASLSAAITQSGTKIFTKTQTNKVIKEYAKDHNIGFNEAKEKLENYSNIFEDITNKNLGYTEALENKEESKAKALNLMKSQYLNNIENQINETTDKAINSLNERIEQAKAELKQIDEEGVLDANDPEIQKMVLDKYNLNSLDSLSEKEIEQYKNSLREKYVDRLENPDKYTKYQYEETDNERTNKIYQSADKANIDNTKESRDFVDKMVRVANDLKTDVLFTNNEELKANPNIDLEAIAQDLIQEEQTKKGSELTEKEIEEIKNRVLSEIGGYYNGKTGTIYINADNKTEGAKFIFGHELMHRLEQNKVQEELRKAIFEHAKTKGIYDTERSTLEKLYKGVTKDIDSELVANLLGKLYQDESFVKDLAVKKPNVFTQIFSKLKEMYYKATGQQEKAELEKIVRLYQKVYNEVKEEGFENKKGTKLGLFDRFKKEKYEVIDPKNIEKIGYSDGLVKEIQNKTRNNLKDRENIAYISPEKIKDYLETGGAREIGTTEELISKIRNNGITSPIEIVKTEDGYKIKNGNHRLYIALKMGLNEIPIEYNENIANLVNGTKEEVEDTSFSNDIKYSLNKDNEGRELSKQQQEYFKDSKVRDKNGNLKVMYRGGNENINVFDTNHTATRYTNLGTTYEADVKGFFFTDNIEYAKEFGATKEYYLNVTNPVTMDNIDDLNKIFKPMLDDMLQEQDIYQWQYDKAVEDNTIYRRFIDENGIDWQDIDKPAFDESLKIMKELGYDGFYTNEGNDEKALFVFNSNQIKEVDNENPTTNPDIRYSLSPSGEMLDNTTGKKVELDASDVGNTGTLMAIHNLSEEKFNGVLDLGGFPVPSIAITNPSKVNHNQFGEGSAIFSKDTIDPAIAENEVYDRDVWSPTFPQIEYDVNVKALNKVRNIVGGYGNEYLSEANSKLNNIDSLIGNKGYEKLKDELKDNKAFKYVYYKTINPDFKVFTKMDSDDVSTRYSNQFLKEFIDEYGKEIPNWGSIDSETRKEIVDEFKKKWIPILEEKRDRIIAEENAKEEPRKYIIGIAESTVENNLEWLDSLGGQDKLIENLNEIQRTGGTKEVKDYSKTNEFIEKNVDQKEYEQWLDDNFKDIVGKKGIYNGKEYLTSKGNRRTFNQLHEDYNLSNLVKELTKQSTVAGESGFGAGQNFGTLQAKMSNKFNSIQDIKNAENRIQYDNNTKELLDKYSSDIYDYMNELREYSYNKNHDYYYGDNAGYALNDFADYKVQNVDNLKKALEKNGINSKEVPNKLLNDVVNKINELKNIPTDYFEAKPQRAVGLDEIGIMVIPNNWSEATKQRMTDNNIKYVEYDPNVEGDRQRVTNQFDNLKFSMGNNPGSITPNDMVVKELYGELPLPTKKQADLPFVDKKEEKTTEDKRLQNKINKESEKAIKIATKDMELNRQELKQLRQDLEKYKGKTREELTNAETFNDIYDIVSNYANRNYIQTDEELKAVQNEIRKTRIRVPEELKKQITDYNYFRKQNMGRLMLSNSGQSIDSVYEELSNSYPGYFKDATTEADMLYELADFMNKDANTIMEYQLTDTELNNQATKIFNKLVTNTLNENDINEIQEKLSKKKISRKDVRNIFLDEMGLTVEDISKGKDINPISYTKTDPVRVNEKVYGNEIGDKINNATINVTKHNEAEKTRFLNQEIDEIKDLGIKARSKESAAVQKYGEKYYINKQGEKVPYGDRELASEFKDAKTQEKIKHAAEVIRSKYDKYIDKANTVLEKMGYNMIPKRSDYMHHFQELTDIFSKWGIPFNPQSMSDDLLPTDINGLTEFNRPGKNWFSAAQQRMGEKTTYDAITGIDQYLRGVSDLIYHTEDIQRYRALEELIRNTYGQEHGLENAEGLTEEEFNQRVADIQANKLSGYASWLNEQANTLANKKSTIDRGFEKTFGRKVYNAMNTLKTQVGSNMTGFNVRSALTNFISTTLAASKTNKLAMVKGTVQTINNIFHKDNFIDKSDFLTSRFGSDVLSKKGWQKLASAGQIFMSGTDWFTSNVIVRSKYYEGLAKGMTEEQAIKYADDFGFRVMGDRSKGSTANAFNSKTLGLLTQFQLEVNNQWDFMLHDSKRDYNLAEDKSKATAGILFQMGQLAAYSYLANELFEKFTGSRVTFDPIEIFKKLFGLDDDDKDKSVEERMTEASQLLIDSLPFVSTFTGGRIPLSSALPNMEELITGKDKYGNKKSRLDTLKEPLPYLFMPTGYSQLNKTKGALEMYDSSLPVAGSYTDSGNLRFTTKTDAASTARNLLFGKWSSEEAQDYLDSGYKTIPANKVQEMIDLNMDSTEYRAYRKGLSEAGTTNSEKINYINTLPYSDEKKSIMASNVAKKDINMEDYNTYGDYDEFVYATNNPEKYSAITQITDFKTYNQYNNEINSLKQQFSDTNSRKQAIFNYINNLDLNKNQKLMLYRLAGGYSIKNYKTQMFNYIDSLNLSKEEKQTIYNELF